MLVDLFIIPIKDHILNEHLLYNLMKLASKLKFFSMKIYNFYTDLNAAPLHFLSIFLGMIILEIILKI